MDHESAVYLSIRALATENPTVSPRYPRLCLVVLQFVGVDMMHLVSRRIPQDH